MSTDTVSFPGNGKKGVSQEWREVKGGLGLSAMAATVLRKDHGMTRFGQEVVVFWATLFYSGFAAIGAERNLVGGNSKQEGIEELALASWLGVSGVNRVGKVMKTVESSLEGKPPKRDVID
jgi:hypothetical protein